MWNSEHVRAEKLTPTHLYDLLVSNKDVEQDITDEMGDVL